jgi:hypothetical protein
MAVLRADALRSLGYASITNSYAVLGGVVTHLWRAFRLVNTTDGDLMISFDGTTNNLILPAGSFVLYDVCTNAAPNTLNDNLFVGINTQLYVKYISAPTKGAVYAEAIYAKGE